LIPTLEVGGAEKQLIRIANQLARITSVSIVTQKSQDSLTKSITPEVNLFVIPSSHRLFYFRALLQLWLLVRGQSRVIVEAFLPSSVIVAAVLRRVLRNEFFLIGNRRSHVFYRSKRPLLAFLDKWATSTCDALVCNSDAVKREALALGEISSGRIFVIPNGVDVESPNLLGVVNQVPQIVYVSNHHPYKRTLTLLEALVHLQDKIFLKTLIFGSGVETESLIEFVRDNELKEVYFQGSVEDPWLHVSPGDIYVHTSETEGFSNSLLEAMAHGLFPVVTDIPANHFVAGQAALYFPVADSQLLAKHILSVSKDHQLRLRTIQESLERVHNSFSMSAVLQKRLEVYSQLR
jgi:glycosyltransferase involved in cell wall biosynthesis